MKKSPNHLAALSYRKRGWRVIPLNGVDDLGNCTCGNRCDAKTRGKHPLYSRSITNASTLDDLNQWFRDFPYWNVGIETGHHSRLFVLDTDGIEGHQSWQKLCKDNDYPLNPRTPTVSTGRDKYSFHRYFKSPKKLRIRGGAGEIATGIDHRCDGNYIVAPPSTHYSGREYQWVDGFSLDDVDLLPLPPFIVRHFESKQRERQALQRQWAEAKAKRESEYTDAEHKARVAYAQGALIQAATTVACASHGSRNQTLNAQTYSIARFVPEYLDYSDVYISMCAASPLESSSATEAVVRCALSAGSGRDPFPSGFEFRSGRNNYSDNQPLWEVLRRKTSKR